MVAIVIVMVIVLIIIKVMVVVIRIVIILVMVVVLKIRSPMVGSLVVRSQWWVPLWYAPSSGLPNSGLPSSELPMGWPAGLDGWLQAVRSDGCAALVRLGWAGWPAASRPAGRLRCTGWTAALR